MKKAGNEERKLAIENGDITESGVPYITVIVDGGWSHRSHGHRYTANSGVSCVIGFRTKKLLQVDVRNKYCSLCEFLKKQGVSNKHEQCYKNWDGPSPSMESDMLVEAFRRSKDIHGVEYRGMVGDGDSSVYKKIVESVSYGMHVKKFECANHAVKNYTKSLFRAQKSSTFFKKSLNNNIISRLKKAVRGAITYYAKTNGSVEDLKRDIKNSPLHVFGNHGNCQTYFCKEDKIATSLSEPILKIIECVQDCAKPLLRNASKLITNYTSNMAENYMSLVAKFVGGKQINRSKRGSYTHRTHAAALDYQLGPSWHYETMKTILKKSPASIVKKTAIRKRKRLLVSRRRLTYKPQGKLKKRREIEENKMSQDYGSLCQQIDMDLEDLKRESKDFLAKIQVSQEKQKMIELSTRGQSENEEWFEERKFRITASNFGLICKRKKHRHGLL